MITGADPLCPVCALIIGECRVDGCFLCRQSPMGSDTACLSWALRDNRDSELVDLILAGYADLKVEIGGCHRTGLVISVLSDRPPTEADNRHSSAGQSCGDLFTVLAANCQILYHGSPSLPGLPFRSSQPLSLRYTSPRTSQCGPTIGREEISLNL